MPHMQETIAISPASTDAKSSNTSWLFLALALVFIWFELVNQLRPEWWLNPQYNYGLIVPLVALYLFWKRWRNRPAPDSATKKVIPVFIIVAFSTLFLPIRFLAEANPDWRLLSWVLALIVTSITLAFVYLLGGRPWLRHFSFPILFFLVAVPWPVRIEQMVIQDLMRMVTAINVTVLQLAGVPALQHGNVIEVGSGFIGIEEACSGVRSLQATLMVSLFLGELYLFDVPRRLVLIVVGALLAFLCNVVRTAILVWVGTTKGISAIEAWHDPAGLTILMVCFFGLWIASLIMMRGRVTAGARPSDAGRNVIGLNPALCGAILIWLLLIESGVQFWYRLHQGRASTHWGVIWPQSQTNYKSVPITSAAETLLRYNDGGGAAWEEDGRQWTMFFFRWLPGRTAARFLKVHRPDICLPASGRTLERDNGIQMLAVNGINLPIRSYKFDDGGVPLHVFYCYWDARSSYENVASAEFEDWSPRGRLRAALQGRRDIGAQMLELIVWGYHDDSEAAAALTRELEKIVHAG